MEKTEQVEKIFLQDNNVYVSQSRFISSGKTFAMRNISSVSNHKIEKSKTAQIIIIIIGLLLLFSEELMWWGFALAILGGIWLHFVKNEYSVRIQSNSGEADGLISNDEKYIQNVVNAINEAIIFRG